MENGEQLLGAAANGDGVGQMLDASFFIPAGKELLAELNLF